MIKMKAKWVAGLAAMCLISAVAASLLTAIVFLRGLLGLPQLRLPFATTNLTSGIPTPELPTPTPSPSPTAAPTPTPTPTPTPAPTASSGNDSAADLLNLWQARDLVEKIYAAAAPSVVNIDVVVETTGTATRKTNHGSGLIYNQTGSIVTNASILSIALDKQGKVLANASIRVAIGGAGQTFRAELTGRDLLTGLAVIKIDPGETVLVPAKFAEKTELRVGQMILALGYPDEMLSSGGLTAGIITGLNRPVMLDDGTNLEMIQTNAAISQSCSGGPILNLAGEVIGLANCALNRDVTDTMGYALAAGTVRQVATGLIVNGFVAGRSWLGVSVLLEDGFLELQKPYQLPDGLYISNVIKDSPAYSVDLRKGDVITAINGSAVGTSMDMSKFLQSQPVGSLVTIRIYRRSDGQYRDIKVYLQEYKQ